MIDFTIRIGGEAGTGLVTATTLFSKLLQHSGYYIFSSKDYASQIRGGHNYHSIRFSEKEVSADVDKVDLLIAFDQFSLDKHMGEVKKEGIIIVDEKLNLTSNDSYKVISINISKIEEELKQNNLSNIVLFGSAAKCLGFSWDQCEKLINNYFSKKGNLLTVFNKASLAGYDQTESFYNFQKELKNQGEMVTGNQAISLGALKAGLTFHVQYPMTPVTGILHELSKEAVKNKELTVVQPEDEIAAINMALGASYTGARSMTATSGGGFALMTESLSLAGMAEIPLVIVEGQRPGPATGLPTKTEQGDLKFVVNAGHGDFPLAVIAPSTIEDCYTETKRAFYLAEKYQLPAIVLIDKHLAESFKSTKLEVEESKFTFDYNQKINVVATVETNQLNKDGLFKRYANKETNRTIPGTKDGIYTCTGDEHDDVGEITEDPLIRENMVERRASKTKLLEKELPPPELIGPNIAKLTVISWGSNFGAINEAIEKINKEKLQVNFLNLKYMLPFQKGEVKTLLSNSNDLLLIENNSTGQLGQLIAENTGITIKNKFLKSNGNTFTMDEIHQEIKRWLS
jgi:2-oxoglutarate/2-oxoacid ferredoxin oxidoreductase subunit alpha